MVNLLLDDFYENKNKYIFQKKLFFKNIYRSNCNVGSRSNVKKWPNDLSNGYQPISFSNRKFSKQKKIKIN